MAGRGRPNRTERNATTTGLCDRFCEGITQRIRLGCCFGCCGASGGVFRCSAWGVFESGGLCIVFVCTRCMQKADVQIFRKIYGAAVQTQWLLVVGKLINFM